MGLEMRRKRVERVLHAGVVGVACNRLAKVLEECTAEAVGAEKPVQIAPYDPPVRRGSPFATSVQREPRARRVRSFCDPDVDFVTCDGVACRKIGRVGQGKALLRDLPVTASPVGR